MKIKDELTPTTAEKVLETTTAIRFSESRPVDDFTRTSKRSADNFLSISSVCGT